VLRNASESLSPDGYFIASIPDYDEIMTRLLALSRSQDRWNTATQRDDGGYRYRVGGEHHYLEFETDLSFTAFIASIRRLDAPFGHKYTYYQAGAVERVPEFLIQPRALAKLAAEEGLRIVESQNFLEMIRAPDHNLLKRMGGTTNLSPECRQVVGLFRTLVMTNRKRRR
jgi:hypothetical protein